MDLIGISPQQASMANRETALAKISALVSRFDEQVESYTKSDYNETLTRKDFIDPFFKALGWDMDNEQGFAEAYREVIHEDKIRISGAMKAPDYSFRLGGGKRLFFVEAKKPSVYVKEEIPPAYQIRRYGWSAKLPISIITDFQEFAVYDCTKKPLVSDKASNARIKYITYKDYIKEFDFLYDTFSKEKVLKGSFDKFVLSDTHKKGTATVDKEFLQSLDSWRTYLATSISWNNKDLDEDEINFAVQQTIDRLIFLRIAEDRSVEPYENLKHAIKQGDFYKNLFDQFRHADEKYNSGLFDFTKDKISKNLKIDNKVLKTIISELYYPLSPYEFSVLSVEILGSAYEQFLGKVIRITPAHIAKVEEKPEVRKAGGVYYTPQYIVEYIVKQTVGKLVEGKRPKDIEKIKIVDPACGSGSFLIGAYQYLLDWHKNYYSNNGKPSKGRKDQPLTPEGNLTTSEKKRILINNIFGVDIDVNAVEVTKLSLLLKCMEGETEASIISQLRLFNERVLPTLDNNIKCGNSLIRFDFNDGVLEFEDESEKTVKPFDWEKSFPIVFENGGFDCVIGNPPYVRPHNLEDYVKEYFWKHYKSFVKKADLYCCFIEKGISILKKNGLLGFIVSNGWLRLDSFHELRNLILSHSKVLSLIDFTNNVFEAAVVKTMITILQKQVDSNSGYEIETAVIDSSLIENKVALPINRIKQNYFQKTYKQIFDLSSNLSANSLKDKISNSHSRLDVGYEISFGLKTGDDKIFLSKNRSTKDHKPLLRGADIHRYQKEFAGEYVWYVPEKMRKHRKTARPGTADRFEQPKVLIRDTGNCLEGTFENESYYVKDVLVITHTNKDLGSLKYLCGIINSKLMKYYYETSFPTLHVQRNEIASLPIPDLSELNDKKSSLSIEIIKNVEAILELNERLRLLKLPEKIEHIQNKINFTDDKINQAVYQLYELTEEEIKLVERK